MARCNCARWGVEAICLRIGAVLADEDPTMDADNLQIWPNHRDFVPLVGKSLLTNVSFEIYYGISNNKRTFNVLSNAQRAR